MKIEILGWLCFLSFTCFGQCTIDIKICHESWGFFCKNVNGESISFDDFVVNVDTLNQRSIENYLCEMSHEKCCKGIKEFTPTELENLQYLTKANLSCNQIVALATLKACVGSQVLYRSEVWDVLTTKEYFTGNDYLDLKDKWMKLIIGKEIYMVMRDKEFSKFVEDD